MRRILAWLRGLRDEYVSPAYLDRLRLAEPDEPERRRYHRPGPLLSASRAYREPWREHHDQ